jgi:hypothetical protein
LKEKAVIDEINFKNEVEQRFNEIKKSPEYLNFVSANTYINNMTRIRNIIF